MPTTATATRTTVLMYLLMLLYGGFTTVVGSVLTNLLAEFGIELSSGGVFYAVQSIGYFAGIALSGAIIERYNKHRLIILFYAALTAALIALNFSPGLNFFLCFVALAGMTSMVVDVLLNASLAQLHERNRGFYMNLLHCCFGIGSFLGPVFAGFMVDRFGSWRLAYLLLGALCAAAVGLYAALASDPAAARAAAAGVAVAPAAPATFRSLWRGRTVLAWLVLFFYISHQGGLNNWLPTYLRIELGLDAVEAGAGLSVFWLGLIVSRLCGSFMTRWQDEKTLTWTGCALGGVAFAAGVLVGGKTALFTGAALIGFFSGATVPMILTLAYAWFPHAKGLASTVLYTGISMGHIVFPWLMGRIEGVYGLKVAMLLDAAALVAAAALTLALPRADDGPGSNAQR